VDYLKNIERIRPGSHNLYISNRFNPHLFTNLTKLVLNLFNFDQTSTLYNLKYCCSISEQAEMLKQKIEYAVTD
jgi:hypothetical protein